MHFVSSKSQKSGVKVNQVSRIRLPIRYWRAEMRLKLTLNCLVAAVVGFSLLSLTSPAQATVTCAPGTYVASYDSSICIPTRPGTYTAASGALAPVVCPPGTYQAHYGKTSCTQNPPGTSSNAYLPEPIYPSKCPIGTFAANLGSVICVPAPSGSYVPTNGSTAALTCPTPISPTTVKTTATGATSIRECYDFATSQLVSPRAGETCDSELTFEFNVIGLTFDTYVAWVSLTERATPNRVFQVRRTIYKAPNSTAGYVSIQQKWENNPSYYGCSISCTDGNRVTSLPVGAYDVTFEIKPPEFEANQTPLFTQTINNVVLRDTSTVTPVIYLPWSNRFDTLSSIRRSSLSFGEPALAGSRKIVFQNEPSFAPTSSGLKTRTFTLENSLSLGLDVDLLYSAASLGVYSFTGDAITPGQWWVSVQMQDTSSNPVASNFWLTPILIVRDCPAGQFSVNGIEACIDVPIGYGGNYPASDLVVPLNKEFPPYPCPLGTFSMGGTGGICLDAPPGMYVASIASAAAIFCSAGTFQPEIGKSSCINAPLGHFVADLGSVSAIPCLPGTYQSNVRQTSCLPSPACYFSNASGSPLAIPCDAGTYQPDTGKSSCIPAPAGNFVSLVGSTSFTACPTGTQQLATGQSSCVASLAAIVAAPVYAPTIKVKKSINASALARGLQITIPKESKVTVKRAGSSKKACRVKANKLIAMKAGSCLATVTVQGPKPKKGKKPAAIKATVVVTVVK